MELQHRSCPQGSASVALREWQGWGDLFSPHRGSGIFLWFWKHRREVILVQECLPFPLKHCQLWGDRHRGLCTSPCGRQAKGTSLCSSFTGVMDGVSCSQLEQEGETAGRSSMSLPGAAGSLVSFQLPQAGREPAGSMWDTALGEHRPLGSMCGVTQ